MRKRREILPRIRDGDDLLAAADAVVELALSEPRSRVGHVDAEPVGVAGDGVAALVPLDRLVVLAHALGAEPPGLQEKVSLAVRTCQRQCVVERSRRLVELAGPLEHLRERLPCVGDLRGIHGVRDLERPPVERRGIDVGPLRCGPACGEHRIAPGAVADSAAQVMERQQLRRVVAVAFLEDVRDAPVELPPAPVREPFVGAVANQGVSEPEAPGTSGSRSTNSPRRLHASESDAAVGSSSSTLAITAPENDVPRTDAQRRSARSAGASRSIRVATSASTVSGSCSRSRSPPPEPRALGGKVGCLRLCRRSHPAPPPKALGRRRPPESSNFASSGGSGSSRSVSAGKGGTPFGREESALARPTSRAGEPRRVGSCVPRWRRSSVDASSIQ